MAYHNTSNLRLEVERETAVTNLVQNPKGELGAWFYRTPVTNTFMENWGPNYLRFRTTVAQASYLTTLPMPVTAGKFVASRITIGSISFADNVKIRYEWLDANKALLSTSIQSGALTAGTRYGPTVQAPANTVYFRLRIDLYTGSGNPSMGGSFTFTQLMATANNSGTPTTVRTNLQPNPSFETTLVDWTGVNGTISQRNTVAFRGTYSIRVTKDATASSYMGINSAGPGIGMGVSGGKDYSAQAYVYPTAAGRNAEVYIQFYNSLGVLVGTSTSVQAVGANAWTQVTNTATAPSDATEGRVRVGFRNPTGDIPTNELGYVDAFMFEESDAPTTYFDGSTAADSQWSYAWTGTAHNSVSKATSASATFPYVEPHSWLNIMGPTFSVEWERKSLDVGLLTANIQDALLDPAIADTLRPGKRIRLVGLLSGVWTEMFTGRISDINVTYPMPDAGGAIPTQIQLSATDAITTLANQMENQGVAAVADLPYILETKGVPWNINGSGNQVPTATIVSYNENASTLDQIEVTRATAQGYAWVDKQGRINVYDPGQMDTAEKAQFSSLGSLSYSDIAVDFDLDRCINSVSVKFLRYNAGSGSTEEVTYGPYVNQASIDTWGARSAEFTIQGATESESAIEAYAQNVLNANATPVRKANSLVMPVRNADEFSKALTLDLYHVVGVNYSDSDSTLVDAQYFITGIKHSLTPEEWTVAFSFDGTASVAMPTVTPSPPFDGIRMGTAQAGFVQMFAGQASMVPAGWLLCNGSTFSATQYPQLAAVLGDTYGVHSGDLYRLPDLRRRAPYGATADAPALALGTNDGDTLANREINHKHGVGTLDTANADVPHNTAANTTTGGTAARVTNLGASNGTHKHTVTGETASESSPYIALNFIIKV